MKFFHLSDLHIGLKLMNRDLRAQSERMAAEATELSLSASQTFMDAYVDCMSFMAF